MHPVTIYSLYIIRPKIHILAIEIGANNFSSIMAVCGKCMKKRKHGYYIHVLRIYNQKKLIKTNQGTRKDSLIQLYRICGLEHATTHRHSAAEAAAHRHATAHAATEAAHAAAEAAHAATATELLT